MASDGGFFADDIFPSIVAGKVWPHSTRGVAEMELTVGAISPSVGTLEEESSSCRRVASFVVFFNEPTAVQTSQR